MKRILRIKKINFRIAGYYTLLIISIGIVITIINTTLYSREVSDQVTNILSQKVDLIASKLDKNMSDIKNIHSSILNNSAINQVFQSVADAPTEENISVLSKLLNQLRDSKAKSILALSLDGQVYSTNSAFPAYRDLVEGNPDYDYFISSRRYTAFSRPNTFPLEYLNPTELEKTNITFYGQYFNNDTFQLLGSIVINFNKNYLFNDISQLADDSFVSVSIVDDINGNIIYQTGTRAFADIALLEPDSDLKIDGQSYHVFARDLTNYHDWKVVCLFDNSLAALRTQRLNMIIYLVLLASVFPMIFLSWIISRNITNPIKEVVLSMEEFRKGNWPKPLRTYSEDEIKSLIEGYNAMLDSVTTLTNNIVKRHEEKKMIEMDLIKTQIGLLEAQINPHFIHNTLNSMNYLAIKGGNTELSDLIQSFNKLLRVSMAVNIDLITVTQEIQNIKEYAMIQSIRYENVFSVDYKIDPEVCLGKIPKLILQPLVENSIIHGILPKKSKGMILIEISKKDNNIYVAVKDNGVGFKEDMEAIMNKENKAQRIGLKNVKERIALLYGNEIDFLISSSPNETTVSFRIPYRD